MPGEVKPRIDPDESVSAAIRTVFSAFSKNGSIRQAWLWLRAEGLDFPQRRTGSQEIRWVKPTYIKIREMLISPVYAGAHLYGKTRVERYVDGEGTVRIRRRNLPRSEWGALLLDHHDGYIDYETFQLKQRRIAANMRRGR